MVDGSPSLGVDALQYDDGMEDPRELKKHDEVHGQRQRSCQFWTRAVSRRSRLPLSAQFSSDHLGLRSKREGISITCGVYGRS
jgi:hypothetical protein